MSTDKQKDLAIELGSIIYTNTINELRQQLVEAKAKNEALSKDAERLDFIEQAAAASRTGVSFCYARIVDDGQVVERGFRMVEFHKMHKRMNNIREAIDAARGVK